ncbi:hypothetical protein LIER_18797 [Lithospermum erythrorhizon]|uniref:Gag-pol polyprotein n=1 Tax=Lithospermum erythrorhizon TaxID=34254 RepID=A0AAV3QKQ6_LITER
MEWVKKTITMSHVVFTSLKETAWEGCYFDNGCSRHMTGNQSNLSNIKKLSGDFVTFGGGAKGKIIGKGILIVDGLPSLKDVLLVDGLTVNLISISQLCDEGMQVAFSKNACTVSDTDEQIMKGARSSDNCYLWNPQKALSSRKEPRQKFDFKGEKEIFLGYSRNSRALRVYNKRTQVVMESINVKVVDEEAEHTETEQRNM